MSALGESPEEMKFILILREQSNWRRRKGKKHKSIWRDQSKQIGRKKNAYNVL